MIHTKQTSEIQRAASAGTHSLTHTHMRTHTDTSTHTQTHIHAHPCAHIHTHFPPVPLHPLRKEEKRDEGALQGAEVLRSGVLNAVVLHGHTVCRCNLHGVFSIALTPPNPTSSLSHSINITCTERSTVARTLTLQPIGASVCRYLIS